LALGLILTVIFINASASQYALEPLKDVRGRLIQAKPETGSRGDFNVVFIRRSSSRA